MSFKQKPLAATLCLLALPFSPAQAQTADETIVVTATRQPIRLNESTADISVINREAIETAGVTTLPELLARQPGIQYSDNGGFGKAANLYLRGTEARHVLLLVDGMPMGSATTGAPSLSGIPLDNVERIEILRGPASALYGSDAVGGVIQIFTRRNEKGGPRLTAFAGAGSYGTEQANASLSGGNALIRYGLAMGHFRTDGHNIKPEPTANPDKDGYQSNTVSGNFDLTLAPGHEIGLNLYQAYGRNYFDSSANYTDFDKNRLHGYGLHLRNQLASFWTSTLAMSKSGDYNDSYTAFGMNKYNTDQQKQSWQNDFKLPVGSLLVAYETQEQKVFSTTDYIRTSKTVDAWVLGYNASLNKHQLQMALRDTDDSQFGGKTTGNLGYGYRLLPSLLARAAYGTAYKAPSFNQLYYNHPVYGTGNPNLVPEESQTWEGGLNWEEGVHRASITYYETEVENLIAGWPPVNVGQASMKGTTVSYDGRLGNWLLGANLDLLRARDDITGKRLPRRAEQQLGLHATYQQSRWEAGAELLAVGDRFDDTANTPSKHMGGYTLLNAHARYRLDNRWALELQGRNLTDKDYATSWGYAPAGAAVFIGLRYTGL